jgi:hypothetical protein
MGRLRISLALLMLLVVVAAVGAAGLAAGTYGWYYAIYSLTALTLFVAAVAACRLGPTWRAVAVVGWLYFLLGLGPWHNTIGSSNQADRTINDALLTSRWLYLLCDRYVPNLPPGHPEYVYRSQDRFVRRANTIGIGHGLLTLLVAAAAGLLSQALAARWAEASGFPLAFLVLLVVVAVVGVVGLAAGTYEWFHVIYSLTVLTLFVAAVAACRLGPAWRAFAVAGWLYFLLGLGPWFSPRNFYGDARDKTINDALLTSRWLYLLCDRYVPELPPGHPAYVNRVHERFHRMANTTGIGHGLLTLLVAVAAGLLSRVFTARRPEALATAGPESVPPVDRAHTRRSED